MRTLRVPDPKPIAPAGSAAGGSTQVGDKRSRTVAGIGVGEEEYGCTYALPPSLGRFPLSRVHDFRATLPPEWVARGGVFLPMYQREAMWMYFKGDSSRPVAVKISIGGVNVLTGQPLTRGLGGVDGKTQDYVTVPPRPWLDGICTWPGVVRQFVAMPLGSGYTV